MKHLTQSIPYGKDFTGNKEIFEKIVLHIWKQGWSIGDPRSSKGITHIGDNKYEIPITLSDAIMAGSGGTGLFWIEDDEVKYKFELEWMS